MLSIVSKYSAITDLIEAWSHFEEYLGKDGPQLGVRCIPDQFVQCNDRFCRHLERQATVFPSAQFSIALVFLPTVPHPSYLPHRQVLTLLHPHKRMRIESLDQPIRPSHGSITGMRRVWIYSKSHSFPGLKWSNKSWMIYIILYSIPFLSVDFDPWVPSADSRHNHRIVLHWRNRLDQGTWSRFLFFQSLNNCPVSDLCPFMV